MRRLPWCVLALLSLQSASALAGTFPDIGYDPPAGWQGGRFEMSQDYPDKEPPVEPVPWKTIDFKTEPQKYMEAVLGYCFEGNREVDWIVQKNKVRKWYHAPWLHWGPSGREFVRGLTKERMSKPFELAATQDKAYNNHAVGFYNARGAYTIGKVWRNPKKPDAASSMFIEDAVSFKLLFTTTPASKIPYLSGSPEWVADVNRSEDAKEVAKTTVRLLQIDISVRDSRSAAAGWVMGTFQYDNTMPGTDPWKKIRPLALMWGNDPQFKQSDYDAGGRPTESWINTEAAVVKYRSNLPAGSKAPRVLGLAGRANGPVDNAGSSCISCHSTAQIPGKSQMTPPDGLNEKEALRWFRNLAIGEPFDAGSQTLDFSLQLGVGIQNFLEFTEFIDNAGGRTTATEGKGELFLAPTQRPSRQWKGPIPQQYRFSRDPNEAPENILDRASGRGGK